MLLISDLEILHEEIAILEMIYKEFQNPSAEPESQYEIVWLPLLDQASLWTERKQKQFESLQTTMPWYFLHNPSLVDQAVVKFIKNVWNFHKKTILVVLDPQGRVVNPNALHMIWIWVDLAFPFTSVREEARWKEEIWKLELLVDAIDPVILEWVSQYHNFHLFYFTFTSSRTLTSFFINLFLIVSFVRFLKEDIYAYMEGRT